VKDKVGARDRLRPTRVALEVRGGESQSIAAVGARAFQQRAHLRLAGKTSDGRADVMTLSEQLQDAMPADEARSARHQNQAHNAPP
jgi:hypothetical protein